MRLLWRLWARIDGQTTCVRCSKPWSRVEERVVWAERGDEFSRGWFFLCLGCWDRSSGLERHWAAEAFMDRWHYWELGPMIHAAIERG